MYVRMYVCNVCIICMHVCMYVCMYVCYGMLMLSYVMLCYGVYL